MACRHVAPVGQNGPDALAIAVRHVREVLPDTPLLSTENRIATADDERRIAYTATAQSHLSGAIHDGTDVRGYLHWSALDNYEWGHWGPPSASLP